MEWLRTPQAMFAKIDAYPYDVVMSRTTLIPHALRNAWDSSSLLLSVLYFSNQTCRQRQLYPDGSQDHSPYLPAAESCFLSLAWFVCWLRPLIFQLKTWSWMSPYVESIREHWCWPRLCLHSLLLEASIMQSRQFGFVKRFSREISNWTKINTVEQLGDIFTKGLTRVVFGYLQKKIMGW